MALEITAEQKSFSGAEAGGGPKAHLRAVLWTEHRYERQYSSWPSIQCMSCAILLYSNWLANTRVLQIPRRGGEGPHVRHDLSLAEDMPVSMLKIALEPHGF